MIVSNIIYNRAKAQSYALTKGMIDVIAKWIMKRSKKKSTNVTHENLGTRNDKFYSQMDVQKKLTCVLKFSFS